MVYFCMVNTTSLLVFLINLSIYYVWTNIKDQCKKMNQKMVFIQQTDMSSPLYIVPLFFVAHQVFWKYFLWNFIKNVWAIFFPPDDYQCSKHVKKIFKKVTQKIILSYFLEIFFTFLYVLWILFIFIYIYIYIVRVRVWQCYRESVCERVVKL